MSLLIFVCPNHDVRLFLFSPRYPWFCEDVSFLIFHADSCEPQSAIHKGWEWMLRRTFDEIAVLNRDVFLSVCERATCVQLHPLPSLCSFPVPLLHSDSHTAAITLYAFGSVREKNDGKDLTPFLAPNFIRSRLIHRPDFFARLCVSLTHIFPAAACVIFRSPFLLLLLLLTRLMISWRSSFDVSVIDCCSNTHHLSSCPSGARVTNLTDT